jgi:hypothetical protein
LPPQAHGSVANSQQNCKAVELTILLEADSIVQNMGPMKKPKREEACVNKYGSKINNIACWGPIPDDSLRAEVLCSYKVAKKQNQ